MGVSLGLHALVFGLIANAPPSAEPSPHRPLELEFIALTREEPQPPQPPEVVPAPKAAAPKKKPAPADAVIASVPPPSGAPGVEGSGAPTSADATAGTRGDLPVAARPSLTPSTGFALRLGSRDLDEGPRGTTVRNGPGEAPDQASLNEYTGEVLTRKLNADLREEVGLAAVEVGNVPTHFKRYETAMRTALPKAKIDVTPLNGKQTLADLAPLLFNEGPSAAAQKKIADSPLGQSVQRQTVMSPNVEDQRFRESALSMLSQTENIKERATRTRLRTVLELTTDASGALADVSIIEKSGDPRFDESVLHFSRKVARTLPDADDKLLGTSMWRTRWQFTWEPPDVRVRLLNAWRVGP